MLAHLSIMILYYIKYLMHITCYLAYCKMLVYHQALHIYLLKLLQECPGHSQHECCMLDFWDARARLISVSLQMLMLTLWEMVTIRNTRLTSYYRNILVGC